MSLSEAAAPPPRRLARLRKRSKGLASTSSNSLNRSSGDDDSLAYNAVEGDNGGLRASMVKDRTRRRSADVRTDADDPSGGRLVTLLSKTKRRARRGRSGGADDVERNRSVDSETAGLPGSRSDSSLLLDESGRSSLLTYDEHSDSDGQPVRPSLTPRDSHAPYLTLTSPQISALIPGADLVSSPEAATPNDPLSSIPHIVEPDSVDSPTATPASGTNTASVNKSRSPFTLSRKKSSGEDSAKSTGGSSGGGLAGLFRSQSRANSVSSQPSTELQKTGVGPISDVAAGQGQPDKGQERPETPKASGRQTLQASLTLFATPPDLLEPPTTLVTPPTPTDSHADAPTFSKPTPRKGSPHSFHSIEHIRHRRAQSATLPSKLSTAVSAPLTPTAEETKTPGGTLTQPGQATISSGFFSSVFSAAQKAGAQFSTSILPSQKARPGSAPVADSVPGEEVIPGAESRPDTGAKEGERKQLAVATLGKGSLSLSHLGIPESQEPTPMNSTTVLSHTETQMPNGERGREVEKEAAARAVSSAYEKPVSAAVSQIAGRPISSASNERLTINGDQTPPRSIAEADINGIKRSGSVRSKLSGRRRKHRGSSATVGTGNSIAAALQHTSTGLANPSAHGLGHRLTGFAVASSKRNKDFHQLFRSVPEDDYLIEDYSAALQRDILLHGRLYVSEGHICFSSNILGWVTNLVISFDEVVSVEKKSTAVIFPNAIVISTLNARNTFASFVARDSTYELLIGIWKISHPNLKSSLNGVTLDDAGTGDKTEVAEPEGSENESEGSEDEVYDEDADDDAASYTDGGFVASAAASDAGEATLSRKPSAMPVSSGQVNGAGSKGLEAADAVVTAAAVSSEFPGAPTHEPTQCADSAEHYDRPLTDTTIPAPLGKVYSMMFGPASGAFMRKWLVEDQKSGNLNYPDDKTGLDNEHTSFTFDYIKPLSAPVGPRQTRCITTNTLKAFDLEKAVSIDCSTQTPDVPSGNVFTTKTRYCLMWGPGNSTRMIASCTIEWTGKSWLKGPIEKGAEQGQTDYVKAIVAAIKAAVTTKPPVKGIQRKGKRKGKKEVYDAEEANIQREAAIVAEKKAPTWGALEPVHQILDPIVSLVRPLITPQVIIVVLLVLLAYSWFSKSQTATTVGHAGHGSPERIAAYEEIWRREESALWDWLDDRVGLHGDYAAPLNDEKQARQKTLHARNMHEKLDDRMSERQMDEQIRTTEEKLTALKEAVERRKMQRSKAPQP